MALTVANEVKKAALDGIAPLFNNGQMRLLTGADAELAMPLFNATAFAAASTASPSAAVANAFTADATVTAGTIAKFDMRTSGGVSRIDGTVGVGTGDLQVSDNVIPVTATSVNMASLTLTLQIT